MKNIPVDKIKQLFEELVSLPINNREKFLDDVCKDNPELRKELLSLLASFEQSGDFLASPGIEINVHSDDIQNPLIGKHIGPYLVESEIGFGGMGIVYGGRRDDKEFEQKVAIKILKHGLTSEYLLKRFQIERQTLANLQHENIARLLDGGKTEEGMPYLVMEFIDGTPITNYCNDADLSVKERLRLFQKVCAAVQYAHQSLVIHRDIKPGNILVNKEGVPKLLDFGIAKLLDEDGGEGGEQLTRTGVWHLTPDYSSPEQIKGEQITTASDIYSLGVLLYEMLAGDQPYRITTRSPLEISRIITEDNVLRPSEKVKQTISKVKKNEELPQKLYNPERVSTQLQGDLDNIVLKAMNKEPGRRYVSVEQFSEDISRHLNGFPVIARKDTSGYRLAKFISRHKTGFVFSVLLLLLLIAGTIGISWQANIAAGERDRAQVELAKFEEVNNFLLEMLASADPGIESKDVKVYDLLEKATKDVDIKLKNYPKVKSAIKGTLGSTFIGLGEYAKAEELLLESLELNLSLFGEQSSEAAKSYHQLGLCYDWIGNYKLADSFYNKGISVYENISSVPPKDLADNLNDYATFLTNTGNYDSSVTILKRALSIYSLHNVQKSRKVATSINNIAVNLHHQQKVDEAEKYYLEAMEILSGLYGPNIPEIASIYNNLAFIYIDKNMYGESEKSLIRSNEIKKSVFGDDHPSLGLGYVNLGMLYFLKKDYKQAEAPLGEALMLFQRINAKTDPTLSLAYYWLGLVYIESEQLKKAEEVLRKSLAIRQQVYPKGNFRIWSTKGELGICLLRQKRYKEAERLLTESFDFFLNQSNRDTKKISRLAENAEILYKETGNQKKAAYYREELNKVNGKKSL